MAQAYPRIDLGGKATRRIGDEQLIKMKLIKELN
jgi:hypothetical protein